MRASSALSARSSSGLANFCRRWHAGDGIQCRMFSRIGGKNMDKAVQKLVALGIPGLVLLVAVAMSGLAGGAAIVAALAFLGGPFGMLGGIAVLGILGLVADAVAEEGLEKVFQAVVDGLKKKGHSVKEIRKTIEGYPISASLKKKILENL